MARIRNETVDQQARDLVKALKDEIEKLRGVLQEAVTMHNVPSEGRQLTCLRDYVLGTIMPSRHPDHVRMELCQRLSGIPVSVFDEVINRSAFSVAAACAPILRSLDDEGPVKDMLWVLLPRDPKAKLPRGRIASELEIRQLLAKHFLRKKNK